MNRMVKKYKLNNFMLGIISVLSVSTWGLLCADNAKVLHIDIKSQSAGTALLNLARSAGVQITVPNDVGVKVRLPSISGQYTLAGALNEMLDGSGLVYEFRDDDSVLVRPVGINEESNGNVKEKSKNVNRQLEEVIITAQKREQSLKDVPISITAIGGVELQERGVDDFQDLGLAVPGMSVVDAGAERFVFMRGIGNALGWSSSLVGIYVDEVSVAANPAYVLDLRLYDIERVEALKGPQGTLYGDGSVGGTIRFITKNPQLDQFGGRVDVSASYTEGGSPSQKLQGVVNIPVIADELAFRISGTVADEGGWMDQPALERDDINERDTANFRIKGLWTPSEAFEVNASAIVHRSDGGINVDEDENGNFAQVFGHLSTPVLEEDYEIYALSLSYDFDAINVQSTTSYIDATRTTIWQSGVRPFDPPPADPFHFMISYSAVTTAFSQELLIRSIASERWNWTVGTFYRDRSVDQAGIGWFGLSDGAGTLPPQFPYLDEQNTKSLAVFGDVSFRVTDRFELGVGVRHFDDDRIFFDGTRQTGSFNAVSPRIYASLDVTDDIKAYASIAKGFRAGGFNQLGQPGYDPEEVWSYETGAKMSLFDDRLDAEVAWFYSEYQGFQISGILPPPAPPFAIIGNAGNAEVMGVDWALTWRATDNLSLHFNGNVVDTEIVEITAASVSHQVGDPLDMVPENSYTLSASYDFYMWQKPGFLRLDYNHKGKATYRNRRYGPHYANESSNIDMFNVVAGWELSESVTFGLFAKNLLDERDFLDPNDLIGFAPRPRPRSFGVNVGVSF